MKTKCQLIIIEKNAYKSFIVKDSGYNIAYYMEQPYYYAEIVQESGTAFIVHSKRANTEITFVVRSETLLIIKEVIETQFDYIMQQYFDLKLKNKNNEGITKTPIKRIFITIENSIVNKRVFYKKQQEKLF